MSQKSPAERQARRQIVLTTAALCAAVPVASISQPMPLSMKVATIDPNTKLITLINIFTVAREDCERLAQLLKEGTDGWISRMPGFVSSTLHVSRDSQRIVIYGQWRNAEDIAAMRQSPEMPAYFERIKAMAMAKMEAITCDVSSTLVA